MTIQHPAKDEMRQRDRRFERLSDDVGQVELIDAFAERRAERVNKDQARQFISLPVEISTPRKPSLLTASESCSSERSGC
jgi:hypothetical protein